MSTERRSHIRAPLILSARFLSPGGEEVDCETIDVSASSVSFRTARPPRVGDLVIAYIRDLGRVQGVATRQFGAGFAMTIASTPLKMHRLEQKIAQLADGDDRRLFQRQEINGASIWLRTAQDERRQVEIIDVSPTGVAFRTDLALKSGERVQIGDREAVVARLFEGGAAASFL